MCLFWVGNKRFHVVFIEKFKKKKTTRNRTTKIRKTIILKSNITNPVPTADCMLMSALKILRKIQVQI